MWQKISWRPAGAGKWLYAGVLLLLALYGSIFYAPSIAYWRFTLGQDRIALGPDIALQLKPGWYPVLATQDATGAHVVVLKINPWFPSEKSASVLNFIYTRIVARLIYPEILRSGRIDFRGELRQPTRMTRSHSHSMEK